MLYQRTVLSTLSILVYNDASSPVALGDNDSDITKPVVSKNNRFWVRMAVILMSPS